MISPDGRRFVPVAHMPPAIRVWKVAIVVNRKCDGMEGEEFGRS